MMELFLLVYWKEITPALRGPKVVIDGKPYVQLSAGDTFRIRFRGDRSTRWIIRSQDRGNLVIFKNGRKYATRKLKKGKNDVRIHFLKGKYEIVSSVDAIARVYVWKKRNWQPIQLLGGGYPIILQKGDRKYTYYIVDRNKPARVKAKGPARLYIYYRAFVKSGKKKVPVEIVVRRDGKVVIKEKKVLKPSRKYTFFDGRKTIGASKPLVLKIDIPEGVHEFEIEVLRSRGAVKVYREELKKRKKRRAARIDFMFGMYRTTNAYRYSQAAIDTFYLGLKDYRYPGVNSIYDDVISARISALWSPGRVFAGASVSYNKYLRNSQLDRLSFSLYGGYRPVELRLGYIPYRPVRPTYVAPLQYELLWFSYAYGRITYSGHAFKTAFTYGRMDFNSTFDNYDADIYKLDATIKAIPVFQPRFQIAYIDAINPDPNLHRDWSNYYLGGGFSVKNRGLDMGILVRRRVYTTSDVQDTHYGRVDVEGKFDLSYRFNLNRWLYLKAGYTYSFRNSTVPQSQLVDVLKDYNEHIFSLRLFSRLRI